jgi:hypothetical protein
MVILREYEFACFFDSSAICQFLPRNSVIDTQLILRLEGRFSHDRCGQVCLPRGLNAVGLHVVRLHCGRTVDCVDAVSYDASFDR